MVTNANGPWRCWGTLLACLAFALTSSALAASAAPSTGTVSGTINRPEPSKRPETPVRNQGFVSRIRNQMIPPRPFDPLPYVIVVLEPQFDLDAESKGPPRTATRYELIGESFRTPLFPVTVKGTLEIRNTGVEAHRLMSPTHADLLPPDPINPKGVRTAKIGVAHQPIRIVDPDSPHLVGTVVGFPLRYFALVDARGDFTIEEVPTGRWKVRLWYRNGWLKVPPVSIEVSARRTTDVKTIGVPARPQVEAAASAAKEGE